MKRLVKCRKVSFFGCERKRVSRNHDRCKYIAIFLIRILSDSRRVRTLTIFTRLSHWFTIFSVAVKLEMENMNDESKNVADCLVFGDVVLDKVFYFYD